MAKYIIMFVGAA